MSLVIIDIWITGITGLIVLGEAIALSIGMNLNKNADRKWLSKKNYAYLTIDIITGIILILFAGIYSSIADWWIPFYLSLTIIIISHMSRNIEYLQKSPTKFLVTIPLFVVNNVKLIGALGSFLLSSWLGLFP